jgi:hypothetical protein
MDDAKYDLVPAGAPTLRYHRLSHAPPAAPRVTLVVGDKEDVSGVDNLMVTTTNWYGRNKHNSMDAVSTGNGDTRRFSVTQLHSSQKQGSGGKRLRDEGTGEGEEQEGVAAPVAAGRRGPKTFVAMMVTPKVQSSDSTCGNAGESYDLQPIDAILRVYRKHEYVEGSSLSSAWSLSIGALEKRTGYTMSKADGVEGEVVEPASIDDKRRARDEAVAKDHQDFLSLADSVKAGGRRGTAVSSTPAPPQPAQKVAKASTPPPPAAASVVSPVPQETIQKAEEPTPTISEGNEAPSDPYVAEVVSQLVASGGVMPPHPPITTTEAAFKAMIKGHPQIKHLQKDREGLVKLFAEVRKAIVAELARMNCGLNGTTIQYPPRK